MGVEPGERSERFDRRLLRYLGSTVSIVEDAEGTMHGVVSLAVLRSFAAGAWQARLDGVWLERGHEPELADLVVRAVMREAERRRCHALVALGALPAPVDAALARLGAATVPGRTLPLVPAPPASARGRRRRS